ncbi:type I pullulanase [Pseudoscardovia radai]|uniref:type I pullulanase n=1 Tax=Pseudoscardovia radai TaxID=987066 RepID=UPI0039913EBE
MRTGKWTSRLTAIVASAAMALGTVSLAPLASAFADDGDPTTTTSTNVNGAATADAFKLNSDVQVIAFQQNWNTIAQECTDTYGPEGVGFVEVSPPQESIQGSEWWTSYQPVSYKLDSKLGTEEEFKNMITTCKAAGVGIIADVVMNNTAAPDGTGKTYTGTNGSEYTPDTASFPGFATSTYPEGITADDFHTCTDKIKDYTNQTEVQQCRLLGMLDFDSESDKVQDIEADYMARMYNYGVVGFRIDAAKHINTDSLNAVKAKLAQKVGKNAADIYWIQEVIGNGSEAAGIQPPHYTQNGTVTEFGFKSEMSQAFNGNVTSLKGLADRLNGDLSSNDANVFVTNWDTERSSGTITYKDGGKYQLANAFMLAYGYGTPRLMSGYKFDSDKTFEEENTKPGAPGATATSVPDVDMNTACSTNTGDWNCEQRWTSTRGLIAFHNYVGDTTSAPVQDWQSNGNDSIAFSRGDKGFLAINNGTKALDVSYDTTLPDGEYCNVYAVEDCSQTVTVADGKVTTTIPARTAVALYAGATKDSHPASTVTTDPSDPENVIEDETVKPTDTTLTIYYKNTDNYATPYIHYGIGSTWTTAPGVAMTKDEATGYWKYTIDTGGQAVSYVFNDGGDTWDNPAGGGNYSAAAGIVQETVADHASTVGAPSDYRANGKTRLVVHYKAAEGDADRALWVWGSNSNTGANLDGAQVEFTGADGWGKVAEFVTDGTWTQFGVIVKATDSWDKVGGDRTATVDATGTAEIWIDGTAADPSATLTAAPEDYVKANTAYDVNITVHYYRDDGLYFNSSDTVNKTPQWDLWTWSGSGTANGRQTFASHDDWGEVSTWTLKGYNYSAASDTAAGDIGLLRRYGGDTWASKDPDDANHFVPAASMVFDAATKTGKAEVWLVSGDPTIYTAQPNLSVKAKSAEISDYNQLTAKLSAESKKDVTATVTDADGNAVETTAVTKSGSTVTITTKDDLSITGKYSVSLKDSDGTDLGTVDAIAGAIVRTDRFDSENAYDGSDLGATNGDGTTTFKVWAPTATDVQLVTFKEATADAEANDPVAMTRGDKGVWSVTIDNTADALAYEYKLTFADGTVNESTDPYATSATANGDRSVVLSNAKADAVTVDAVQGGRVSQGDAIIAETHIRDFTKSETSGVSEANRGKYLGMIETGTKNANGDATGIDYLKELGITDVQLQPFFDYASVDETKTLDDTNYNWGYDPENYNVPEGSYSSDATNPSVRVDETKEMVDGLHDAGIGVVMDVVYNHVASAADSSFNKTVPGYYFRYDSNGNLTNKSGCGNDTASERTMMRKYIVNSVTYWATAYGVDGFRFDLMGLMDTETMKEVREALDKIDPNIIVLGEGWDMAGDSVSSDTTMTTQPNAYLVDNTDGTGSTVSFFNDSIRDGLKGSVFSDTDTGYVSGKAGQENLIAHNMLGCQYDATPGATTCWNGSAQDKYANASQVVQYAEIHDNMTLYDKLRTSNPSDSDTTTMKRAELADSALFLSQGISEIQLGQEFLRTKGGNGNSYNAGDSVNALDWNRQDTYKESVDYVKGLIALRKNVKAFQYSSYADIAANSTMIEAADGVVAFQIKDADATYVVILNANDTAAKVPGLTAGTYRTMVADSKVNATNAADASKLDGVTVGSDGTYTAGALSATMLEIEIPSIVTTSLAEATANTEYTQAIETTHADTVNVYGLPEGLSYDAASGSIHGTPTKGGSYVVTVTAGNADVATPVNATFTLAVHGTAVAIDAKDLPAAETATTYSAPVSVEGDPAPTVRVYGLPEGLAYDAATGTITGEAQKAGDYTVVISVYNKLSAPVTRVVTLSVTGDDVQNVPVYRVYNPGNGEHFYTESADERDGLVAAGWSDEGTAWLAPSKSSEAVYRMYNPVEGTHHFTSNAAERDQLVKAGWNDEGTAFYAAKTSDASAVRRAYNPNTGLHVYTLDSNEYESLVALGWQAEGDAWSSIKATA